MEYCNFSLIELLAKLLTVLEVAAIYSVDSMAVFRLTLVKVKTLELL